MAQVEWSEGAVRSLDRLIVSHSLPADTHARIRRSLEPLRQFPLLGAAIGGRQHDVRFLLGPWRWMIIVYVYFAVDDRVVVVAVEDGRSATAATANV